jgi:hypothetical protein
VTTAFCEDSPESDVCTISESDSDSDADADTEVVSDSELDELGVDMRRFRLCEAAGSRPVCEAPCSTVCAVAPSGGSRTSTLYASELGAERTVVTHHTRSPSLTTVSSHASSSSKPSMERCSEEGETARKAGRDVQRRDLNEETVAWPRCARGNHALTAGSGGFADILTRMEVCCSA